MAERWKIYLLIIFIALTSTPLALEAAKIDVPVLAMIIGHCGMMIVGFIASEMGRTNP